MLDAVVANFVDSVSEREFDAAFMALLRAMDFYDIHFTHGPYEFGKDFIAKRSDHGVVQQYVFQSKAGSFNLGEWSAAAPQVELLRHSEVSHPNFDRGVPRQAVFVLTGRLTGGAITAAQDICRQYAASDVPLTMWDRERLIEYMVTAVTTGLAGRVEAPLLATVAAAADRSITDARIECFSTRWCIEGQQPSACILESAIVSAALHKAGRLDLAAYTGLALVRASRFHMHGNPSANEGWDDAADLGRRLFATYSDLLLDRLGPDGGLATSSMIDAHREAAALITHAVRCVRIAELVGLLGLLDSADGTRRSSHDLAAWLAQFIRRHAAVASIVSDRWAVATIPVTLLFVKHDLREHAADYLREIFIWIVQRYGDGSGLASATAEPEAEVRQVIGRTVPQLTTIQRRDESYLAAVLLELCAFMNLERLYAFARDEFRRMRISLPAVTTNDTTGQYLLDGADVAYEMNVSYADSVPAPWTSVAPHLAGAVSPRKIQSSNRSWDHLAVSALLRDRHFSSAWSALTEQ